MSAFWRRFLLIVGLFVAAGGCNPLMIPFYLTAHDPKAKAEYHKITHGSKKEARVVILTSMGVETRQEFVQADNDIARGLATHLQTLAKENGEKLTIVNPLKIEQYKNENPEWNSSHDGLEEIGKKFRADYIIFIEIGSLSMYQAKSAGSFYQGKADLTLSLINVNDSDDFTQPKQLTFTYPPESQGASLEIDADTPPQKFKMHFLNALCQKLSWQFAERSRRDTRMNYGTNDFQSKLSE